MRIIRPSEKLVQHVRAQESQNPRAFARRRALELGALSLVVSACGDSSGSGTGGSTAAGGTGGGGGTGGAGSGCNALDLMAPVEPAIIGPGEGELLDDNDGRYKVRAGELGNYWSLMELTLDVQQLLAPHTHYGYDQAVYLIEGELGFEFGGEGGEVLTGGAGSYVVKPRGLSHTFWTISDTPVRYIEMSANVTFERFVDGAKEAETPAEINALGEEYDVEFHYDQIPRLLAEHGLTSVKGSAVTLPDLSEFNPPGGPPLP